MSNTHVGRLMDWCWDGFMFMIEVNKLLVIDLKVSVYCLNMMHLL